MLTLAAAFTNLALFWALFKAFERSPTFFNTTHNIKTQNYTQHVIIFSLILFPILTSLIARITH